MNSRRRVNSTVMRGNSIIVKSLACICFLLVATAATAAAIDARLLWEGRSYTGGWEADMGVLDLLSNALHDDTDATGIIFVYGAKRDARGNVERRVTCMEDYMIHRRGIPANRIRVLRGGYREHAWIALWVVPSGSKSPNATPTLRRKNVTLTKRGARYTCNV
jgi:hypothetical protein